MLELPSLIHHAETGLAAVFPASSLFRIQFDDQLFVDRRVDVFSLWQ
jgi:hypothetical protein